MLTLTIALSLLAYACFYLASPGRQSRPVGSPAGLRAVGVGLTLAALASAHALTGSAVGPALVLTVAMAAGSLCVLAGPFGLPAARPARRRAAPAPAQAPSLPPSRPAPNPASTASGR